MIAYMPYTYISQDHIDMIAKGLGTLSVYAPAAALLPGHMRRSSDRDLIDLREPVGLAQDQLALAFEQFKQWAEIHKGGIADMARFFKSSQGRPPLVDESNPTQITNQVRHFGETECDGDVAPLFQAALFLAMAQEYDRHQDEMARDLGAVDTMEKKMMAQLSGDGADPAANFPAGGSAVQVGGAQEPGLYMIDSRIKAWAELAAADDCTSHLYLTTSHAVLDQLTDRFPDALPMGRWDMGAGETEAHVVSKRRETIAAIASSARPEANALSECMTPAGQGGLFCLSVFALVGCPPRAMVKRLLSNDNAPWARLGRPSGTGHTLIGLVDACHD